VHEHHAIVPNADRTALLTVDGRLPVVTTAERRQADVMTALAADHGVRAPFLRTIRRAVEDDRATTLFEVDGSSPAGKREWTALDAVDPDTVAPVFADGLGEWLAEQRGAPVPPERADWAEPGWLEQAVAWVDGVSRLRGEPRLIRQWCLSSMYAFDTEAGTLYLKACLALWPHEPAVTAALARSHPGHVPDVIAIEPDRRWLLMRELMGTPAADAGEEWVATQLRCMAELQRAWIGRDRELVALGAPHRPLGELAREAPDLVPLCERLRAFGVPETLTHGDLHKRNAFVEDDRVVLIDWSDAALAHPFLDLAPALYFAAELSPDRMLDAYLEPWGEDLREAALVGEALGCVHQALSYRAIEAACEPGDRRIWADEPDKWLARARELASKL
jgi:hypothetical protein